MVMCFIFFQVISLSNIYSAGQENVIIGLNQVMERFLYERGLRSEKTVPKGSYHAVLTMKEYDEFNCWRKVGKGKTRRRCRYFKWDKALEIWTSETTVTEIDAGSLFQRVDSDGWVSLSPSEQQHYEMWRDYKWRQLEEDE